MYCRNVNVYIAGGTTVCHFPDYFGLFFINVDVTLEFLISPTITGQHACTYVSISEADHTLDFK